MQNAEFRMKTTPLAVYKHSAFLILHSDFQDSTINYLLGAAAPKSITYSFPFQVLFFLLAVLMELITIDSNSLASSIRD